MSTFDKAKMQVVLDTVTNHLFTQGKRSYGPSANNLDGCVYLAPDGSTCAVGCLLPIGVYTPSIEGQYAYGLADWPEVRDHLNGLMGLSKDAVFSKEDADASPSWTFLHRLQSAHNTWLSGKWADLAPELQRLATSAGLTFNDPATQGEVK